MEPIVDANLTYFHQPTTSLEQYEVIKANPESEILVIGSVFSFRCANDHCRNY